MDRLCNDFLAGAVFAGDQDIRVRRTDPGDQLQNRTHRLGLRNHRRASIGAQQLILSLEPLLVPAPLAEFRLRSNNREQPRVVPWLLNEVAGAMLHRFDGKIDAAPRGHDDNRKGFIDTLYLIQQVEPFPS